MQKTLIGFTLLLLLLISLSCAPFWKTPEYYYEEGQEYFQANDFIKAIKSYSKAIEEKPSYLDAFIGRGICYVRLDSNLAAIKDFDAANAIYPTANAYYFRGCCKYEIKDSLGACSDWENSCELMLNKACDAFSKNCSRRK